MIITQVHLVLRTIKGHYNVQSCHTTLQMSQIEGARNWHADCRNVHQSCCQRIECSFLYHKRRFREFGSMSNRPHNCRLRVWRNVGEQFADVNVVNRVPHGGGGVMAWAGISYRQ